MESQLPKDLHAREKMQGGIRLKEVIDLYPITLSILLTSLKGGGGK